jgi:hypothetical protein
MVRRQRPGGDAGARPLTSDLGWGAIVADPLTGNLETEPVTMAAAKLFELPADWPGPERQFAEVEDF